MQVVILFKYLNSLTKVLKMMMMKDLKILTLKILCMYVTTTLLVTCQVHHHNRFEDFKI